MACKNHASSKGYVALGLVGAVLMAAGDLALGIVSASDADQGLFARQAYLDGQFGAEKLVFMAVAGIVGIYCYWFGLRQAHDSLDEASTKGRLAFRAAARLFLLTALAFHVTIGMGAYLASYLGTHFGADVALQTVGDYYADFSPVWALMYAPIMVLLGIHLVMLLRGRTIYARKMAIFSPVVWAALLNAIPAAHQAITGHVSTLDYALSQSSGNVGMAVWFAACLLLPGTLRLSKGGAGRGA